MDSFGYKTVLVLDHGPYFSDDSTMVVDVSGKASGAEANDRVQCCVTKSLWTCTVEAAIEYQRIVADLFGDQRLIRFVISDSVARFLVSSTWQTPSTSRSPTDILLEALLPIGAPAGDRSDVDSCLIESGISMAVEAVSQSTEAQRQQQNNCKTVVGAAASHNVGRIIVFTKLKRENQISEIWTHVQEQITSRNSVLKRSDESYLEVSDVELCVINVYSKNDSSKMKSLHSPLKRVSENVSCELRSIEGGPQMLRMCHLLLQRHYNLASTTVSGIPMKGESSSGQSINYDVELIHSTEANLELLRCGVIGSDSPIENIDADGYRTVRLLWTTPNSKIPCDLFPNCTSAVRVTPALTNSRPSACLTGFILGGKSVLLEISAKERPDYLSPNFGPKVISSILMNHGGVIFMHSVAFGRGPIEDPPSISEGSGGRVTDYRIAQFGELMKECLLSGNSRGDASQSLGGNADAGIIPSNTPREHLARLTHFWPLVFGDTLLFSCLQKFEPLISLIKKSDMSAEAIERCREAIFALLRMEQNKEVLLGSGVQCAKIKGIRNREDQYRVAFEELAEYLRNYSHISPNHLKVLNSLLSSRSLPKDHQPISIPASLLRYETNCNEIGIKTSADTKPLVAAAIADAAPEDSTLAGSNRPPVIIEPPLKKSRRTAISAAQLQPGEMLNLSNWFTRKYMDEHWSKWKDFDGRIEAEANGSNIAVLYPDLEKKGLAGKQMQHDDAAIKTN